MNEKGVGFKEFRNFGISEGDMLIKEMSCQHVLLLTINATFIYLVDNNLNVMTGLLVRFVYIYQR